MSAATAADSHPGAQIVLETTGSIEGRVFNAANDSYLNNARVVVDGLTREAQTNTVGEYRFANVPAGLVVIKVSVAGMETQTASLEVKAGQLSRQDFSMGLARVGLEANSPVVVLDKFSVYERVLSAQAIAMQEQRIAPNIKNVVSLDEVGELAEGNVGEYLKYVPGFAAVIGPAGVQSVTLRGMPAYGTQVMMDGVPASNPGSTGRAFDFTMTITANVDRLEVVKSPTPDLPANSVGGSINVITKEPFGRKTPLFTYNGFLTYSAHDGFSGFSPKFKKRAGPDATGGEIFNGATNYDVQPSFDLSYTMPVNESLAFTVVANRGVRSLDWDYLNQTWNRATGIQTSNQFNNVISGNANTTLSGKIDWRIGRNDFLQFSVVSSRKEAFTRQNVILSNPAAGATGGETFTQGSSAGVGVVNQSLIPYSMIKTLEHFVLSHRHNGEKWKTQSDFSFSGGGYSIFDTDDGFFGRVNATLTGLVLRNEGFTGVADRKVPVITGTRGGAPINVYDGNNYSINTLQSNPKYFDNDARRASFSVTREEVFGLPVDAKVGLLYEKTERKGVGAGYTWNFVPPGGAAGKIASNFNVIAREYSEFAYFTDVNGDKVKPVWISAQKMYELYRQKPEWFVLDEGAGYISEVNAALNLAETIKATYLRLDSQLMNNRLRLVGGVRYEHATLDGSGPKNDPSAIYLKNADGTLARDGSGKLIPITNNALERTKLQYTRLGTTRQKKGDGFYPSLNVSYDLSEKIVLRAAFARTIGRPDHANIIPNATISDPSNETIDKLISLSNPGLEPWTSNSYDFTIEGYDIKGATLSSSLFQKDIKGFFSNRRSLVTPEILAEYGFSDDYLTYDVQTTVNGGSATIQGIELSYRQSFRFLPAWGRGFQFFANLTKLQLSGPNANDFTEFSPTEFNWGVSYGIGRFYIKANTISTGPMRNSLVSAATATQSASYDYRAPLTRTDLSAGYQFSKRFMVYAVVKNMQSAELRYERYDTSTPSYQRPRVSHFSNTEFALGVRGEF